MSLLSARRSRHLPEHADRSTGVSEQLLFRHQSETLVRLDCNGKVRPGLATEWIGDSAGRSWIFTLSSSTDPQQPAPLTPADVVSSWRDRGPAVNGSGDRLGRCPRRSPLAGHAADHSVIPLPVSLPIPLLPCPLRGSASTVPISGGTGSGSARCPGPRRRPGSHPRSCGRGLRRGSLGVRDISLSHGAGSMPCSSRSLLSRFRFWVRIRCAGPWLRTWPKRRLARPSRRPGGRVSVLPTSRTTPRTRRFQRASYTSGGTELPAAWPNVSSRWRGTRSR